MQFTFLYVAAIYAACVFLWRRLAPASALPRRVAVLFYLLVTILLFRPMTQEYVNVPADYLARLYPWRSIAHDGRNRNGELNDVILQMVPWSHQVRESWKRLEPPLWTDAAGGGYPLLANGQSAALSPFRLIAIPLPLGYSFTAEAALKMLAALTFAFLFARRHFSVRASIVTAISFGFSTFVVVWLHFPHVSVVALLPALFLGLELVTERSTFRRCLFLIGVLTTLLLAGHPESVAHCVFIGTVYQLVLLRASAQRMRIVAALTACGLAALLLASPFLLPFAETLKRSQRYEWIAAELHSLPSFDPRSLVTFLHPEFWGLVKDGNLWGAGIAEQVCGYSGVLGVIGWFAALYRWMARRTWTVAAFRRRSRAVDSETGEPEPPQESRLAAGEPAGRLPALRVPGTSTLERFALISMPLLIAVAVFAPVASDLFQKLPLFSLAANGRLRLVVCWLGALLAGALVNALQQRRNGALFGVAMATAALVIAFLLPEPHDAARVREALITSIPRWIVVAVVLFAAFRMIPRRAAGTMLIIVVTLDLWAFAEHWNPVVEERELYPTTPILERLQALSEGRIHRVTATFGAFFPNSAALYGLEDIRAHDPMANGRYLGALRGFTGYTSDEYFGMLRKFDSRYLDLLNVRYAMMVPNEPTRHGWRVVYRARDGVLVENPDVLPRFFVPAATVVDPADGSRISLMLKRADFARTVYVAELPSVPPAVSSDLRQRDPARASVRRIERSGTSYQLTIDARRPSVIASSIPLYPGWRVARNGEAVETFTSNENFLSFIVPPGRSEVTVRYAPRSFQIGVLLALGTALTLAALSSGRRRQMVLSRIRRTRLASRFL